MRSPKYQNQIEIAPRHPKTDRLFTQTKQRSPIHHPQTPIAYSLKSNSDRPSTPTKPDRLFLPTSNSDRTLTNHKTRSPISPNIKQRSHPHHTQNPIAYFLIKQQSPLTTHKTRSPKSQRQTAIAPHHPQTRSPLITKPDLQILEQIVMSTSISRAKLDKSV